ncbi:hypothetical protein [Phormidesmis priestleyi]|nr:hypothetical protein [Phormidesmis priestleyi]
MARSLDVLADTSGITALLDQGDRRHPAAMLKPQCNIVKISL